MPARLNEQPVKNAVPPSVPTMLPPVQLKAPPTGPLALESVITSKGVGLVIWLPNLSLTRTDVLNGAPVPMFAGGGVVKSRRDGAPGTDPRPPMFAPIGNGVML